ncbi:MAG: FtsX-like permease family protein, partial [Gemmatimonadales bacterium]
MMARVRRGYPRDAAAAITAAIRHVDPEAAVTDVAPMQEVMAASVGRPRFYLLLLGTFAAIAMLLALAGLYGVMSYVVAQGTRDIGIRAALGSGTTKILGMVALQGMRLVGIGLAIGLVASIYTTRLIGGLLYGVSPLDFPTWVATAALLALAALVAALVPAVRATRVDPATAMRVE